MWKWCHTERGRWKWHHMGKGTSSPPLSSPLLSHSGNLNSVPPTLGYWWVAPPPHHMGTLWEILKLCCQHPSTEWNPPPLRNMAGNLKSGGRIKKWQMIWKVLGELKMNPLPTSTNMYDVHTAPRVSSVEPNVTLTDNCLT